MRNKNLNAEATGEPMYTDENNEEGGSGSGGIDFEAVRNMKLSELPKL